MEGKRKMNKYQKIYVEGIKEKMNELNLEFSEIPRDHGDEHKLFYNEIILKMTALQLAFTRYILEVVADRG